MHKKIIAACTTIAALVAFAVVATSASAAPVVTHPTGTVLATGTQLKGTNTGAMRFTSSILNIECSTGTVTGTLTSNSTAGGFQGEITAASISGTGTSGDCTGSGSFFSGSAKVTPETGTNGLPWCIKSTNVGDEAELTGGACGGAARGIRVAVDLTGLVTCTYEKSTASISSFTTDTAGQDATGNIFEFGGLTRVSGFGCPSTGTLDGGGTLEMDSGTADPVYLSS